MWGGGEVDVPFRADPSMVTLYTLQCHESLHGCLCILRQKEASWTKAEGDAVCTPGLFFWRNKSYIHKTPCIDVHSIFISNCSKPGEHGMSKQFLKWLNKEASPQDWVLVIRERGRKGQNY